MRLAQKQPKNVEYVAHFESDHDRQVKALKTILNYHPKPVKKKAEEDGGLPPSLERNA